MSIVAWDGKTLAADRQSTIVDTIFTIKKLWKLDNGEVIAVVGTQDAALTVKRWYESGAKKEDWPKCQEKEDWAKLIVISGGKCFYYDTLPEQIEVIDPFFAWGTGREVALGAMEMGADAVKAVEIASKYVSGCGRGCDFEVVHPKDVKNKIYEPGRLSKRSRVRQDW